ncbi:MAG TPA: nucleotidyl transferase AbiEii/AbiGii toxin family protein [Acidimicrobiales bacterium]|nr:nucleotidyl transferase AbiEii/AbiGii toxin family protein [Acidimicrobiales bacterium]
MSGETRWLEGEATASLVRAADAVVTHAGVRTAVVGGLAVACRLAVAHRATADVDLVADEPALVAGGTAAGSLVQAGLATRVAGSEVVRLDVAGTRVELIETSPVGIEELHDVEPARARLFVLAHRWALDSATQVRVGVVGTDVEVDLPVATPLALMAMKLHAIEDRSEDRKRASDAWDLFRLIDLSAGTPNFRRATEAAPPTLLDLVAEVAERVLISSVTRTRRWMSVYGDPAWASVATEEALADAGRDLLVHVHRHH